MNTLKTPLNLIAFFVGVIAVIVMLVWAGGIATPFVLIAILGGITLVVQSLKPAVSWRAVYLWIIGLASSVWGFVAIVLLALNDSGGPIPLQFLLVLTLPILLLISSVLLCLKEGRSISVLLPTILFGCVILLYLFAQVPKLIQFGISFS